MVEWIRCKKIISFFLCFFLCYLLMCNLLVNSFYHLKADQKVDKIVVRTPQGEFCVTSEEILEEINRQFHMQILISPGVGNLEADSGENFQIVFYNEQNKEMKGFGYNPGNKKVYPGELRLPPDTQVVLERIIHLPNRCEALG